MNQLPPPKLIVFVSGRPEFRCGSLAEASAYVAGRGRGVVLSVVVGDEQQLPRMARRPKGAA